MDTETIEQLNRAEQNFFKVLQSPMTRTIPGLPEALKSMLDIVQIIRQMQENSHD